MLKIDHHIHGTPWNNSWAGFRRAVWYGWHAGCQYLGVAEHGPRFNHRVPYRSLYLNEFDRYFNTLEEIRLEFQPVCQILVGLELDYNADMIQPYSELLPKLPLDFITGSVHTVEDWVIDMDNSLENSELRGKTPLELYQFYFEAVQSAAKSGLFDFIAHPDFIKKGLGKLRLPKPVNLAKIYRETAEILAIYQIGIEINTRGSILPEVGEFYPDELFLRECFRAGVPITISSDAHQPEAVASGITEAMNLAFDIGYRQISVWKKRERISLDLNQ
jgi:histidinol-phosphatase (PHP family)